MDAIKNYLETMFLNLPNTPEVQKAKYELGQMMEDKYRELIADGKTENEAIGTVIAEFGNLDELAEDLGIDSVLHHSQTFEAGRMVSLTEVKEYLKSLAPLISDAPEYLPQTDTSARLSKPCKRQFRYKQIVSLRDVTNWLLIFFLVPAPARPQCFLTYAHKKIRRHKMHLRILSLGFFPKVHRFIFLQFRQKSFFSQEFLNPV